jgi:hypothetical protein
MNLTWNHGICSEKLLELGSSCDLNLKCDHKAGLFCDMDVKRCM